MSTKALRSLNVDCTNNPPNAPLVKFYPAQLRFYRAWYCTRWHKLNAKLVLRGHRGKDKTYMYAKQVENSTFTVCCRIALPGSKLSGII